MRAGVLSKDEVINFLNENFINTWVPNSELGRIDSLINPIAKRREREGTIFDTNHPLAQTIIEGGKTGSKKGSPVDCLIISHEFILLGRQPVNELREDSENRGMNRQKFYLTFLKEALERKYPGLGNIRLSPKYPSQEVLDIFREPNNGDQEYNVVIIDTREFENGGTLTFDIKVGRSDAVGFFYLFNEDSEPPTDERVPEDKLTSIWISHGDKRQLTYSFEQGQIFKMGATGSWRKNNGTVNAFHAKISVEENQIE